MVFYFFLNDHVLRFIIYEFLKNVSGGGWPTCLAKILCALCHPCFFCFVGNHFFYGNGYQILNKKIIYSINLCLVVDWNNFLFILAYFNILTLWEALQTAPKGKSNKEADTIQFFQENKRASSTFSSSSFFKAFRPSGPPSNKIINSKAIP